MNRRVWVLSFALVVVTLGFGLIIPIFPFYIEKLGATGRHYGLLIAIAALFEFLCAPIWGSISDRVGRKPILAIGMVGYALSSLLFGLSTKLWMLFASRALSGLLSSATSATAMAYITDSTSESDRGGSMGMLGAAMGLGMILGPGLGGWLGAEDLALPFYIAAALAVVALLLILLWVPESLPPEQRQRTGSVLQGSSWSSLWHALRGPVGILFGLLFLVSFGLANFESIFGLYAAERLGYGPERVGVILVVVGVVSTLGKATLIGPITKRWGEPPLIRVSLLASAIGFGLLFLAQQYATILLATGLFILSKTFLRTALLSLSSKRAQGGKGAVMGLGNSFINLGRIVGPIWAGFAFDLHHGAPYLSGAAIMLAGFVLSWVWDLAGTRARPETVTRGSQVR